MQHICPPERWRPVVGYEDHYEVSDHGRVRSLDRVMVRKDGVRHHYKGKVLNPTYNFEGGHRKVGLSKGQGYRRYYVHRLVLEAFVGPCPAGMVTCHRDDNPSNNHLSNLRWDTESANQYDKVRNGNHHAVRKTHCKFGHEFTPDNTFDHLGNRGCRTCRRLRQRVHAERMKAKYGPRKNWPKRNSE